VGYPDMGNRIDLDRDCGECQRGSVTGFKSEPARPDGRSDCRLSKPAQLHGDPVSGAGKSLSGFAGQSTEETKLALLLQESADVEGVEAVDRRSCAGDFHDVSGVINCRLAENTHAVATRIVLLFHEHVKAPILRQ